MKTLIVIPCLNEESHLENLVRGLLPFCEAEAAQIVIADGGSRDRTVAMAQELAARHPQIVYLHNPKKIQAAAVNLAVTTYGADATYIIRIDAHADYPADYCRILIDEAVSMQADSVVVAMKTVGKAGFQKAVAAAQNSRLGNGGSAHRSDNGQGKWVIHGHHALIRKDAFESVGGYDESFSCNEDAELDYRLTQAGRRIWLTQKTSLIYYPRATAFGLFRQYAGYGKGRAQTILKHHISPQLRQILPACVIPALLLALLSPFVWWFALPFLLWLALCLGSGIMLARGAQDESTAWAGPALLLMHAGWSFGFWRMMIEAWVRS